MISTRGLVFTLIATTAATGAQPVPSTGTQANALFHRGREQLKKGNLAAACEAFEHSQKLDPRVTTLLNLAGCLEKLGRLATARALFLQAERQTRSKVDDTMAQLHQIASDRAVKLEPRVSKLTIRVPSGHNLKRLEIRRNDELISMEMWNVAMPIDGGTYTIVARAPNMEAWSAKVTVAAEADAKIVEVLELRWLPQNSGAAPTMPTRSGAAGGLLGERGLPFAVATSAVLLLGGGLGVSRWGDSTYNKAQAEITNQARRDSLEASANRKRYVAQAMAISGATCAGVAVWLFIRQRTGQTETVEAHAGLELTPMGSGIGVAGQF